MIGLGTSKIGPSECLFSMTWLYVRHPGNLGSLCPQIPFLRGHGVFGCAVASLYEVMSVRPSVGPSVRPLVRMSRVIFEGEKNAY